MIASHPDVTSGGQATVVILQTVRPDAVSEYRDWQQRIDGAAARFPGFQGAQVTPPAGIQRDWLIVYRFDTQEDLRAWLDSPEFAEHIRSGERYFSSPPRRLTATTQSTSATDAVSVVVLHHVRPGREAAYRAWQRELEAAERRAPGYLGSELIPPGPGSPGLWSAIVRFDTAEHLEAWMTGSARQGLVEAGRTIYRDFDAVPVRSGFEGWFQFGQGGGLVEVPPVWKQAVAVLLGLYPTIAVLRLVLTSHMGGAWPEILLLSAAVSTITLTWLVMPVVNRLLKAWLTPESQRGTSFDVMGAALVGVALLFMWLLFHLVSLALP